MLRATTLLLHHMFCHEFCEIHLSEETGSKKPKISKVEHGVGLRAGRAPCTLGRMGLPGVRGQEGSGVCQHQGPQARKEGDRKGKWRAELPGPQGRKGNLGRVENTPLTFSSPRAVSLVLTPQCDLPGVS